MDWFNGTTSIAGIQIPNRWIAVIAAVVLMLLIYYTTR
jgi:hypothetical protein